MNILLEPQVNPAIREKYILLELDSFRTAPNSKPISSYCVLEQLDIGEMMIMQQYLDLHSNLMPNYRQRNWNYVEQAIDHLRGKWNHQLDSFYEDVINRVAILKVSKLDDDWDGIINRF